MPLNQLLGDGFISRAPEGLMIDLIRGVAWVLAPYYVHCLRVGPREWVAQSMTGAKRAN